jgi:hypothetical protein
MDPRDPRAAGDDQPPEDTGWNAPLPPIRRSDEELTRDYGPVAPEPHWEKPEPYYNRERFLLRCVAWIIGVQFGFYIVATGVCGEITRVKLRILNNTGKEPVSVVFCAALPDKLQNSVDQGLAILLALLGGSALAASDRRQSPRSDPRRGGGDRQP